MPRRRRSCHQRLLRFPLVRCPRVGSLEQIRMARPTRPTMVRIPLCQARAKAPWWERFQEPIPRTLNPVFILTPLLLRYFQVQTTETPGNRAAYSVEFLEAQLIVLEDPTERQRFPNQTFQRPT